MSHVVDIDLVIKRIICLLKPKRNPYIIGFHYTLTENGVTVSGRVNGGESNIMVALAMENGQWLSDYYMVCREVKEAEVIYLPYAGCNPDDIRAWVNEQVTIKLKERKSNE